MRPRAHSRFKAQAAPIPAAPGADALLERFIAEAKAAVTFNPTDGMCRLLNGLIGLRSEKQRERMQDGAEAK